MDTDIILYKDATRIQDVWASNLSEVFVPITMLAKKATYICLDTEFPGVIVKATGDFESLAEFRYKTLEYNVNQLKLIQVGLTFVCLDEENRLEIFYTVQFNMKYDLDRDPGSQESIDFLMKSGIQFDRLKTDGIDPMQLGEFLLASNVVLNRHVTWVTFDGKFDFGYLIKILSGSNLPATDTEFLKRVKLYFGQFYDVKYLGMHSPFLKGGLNSFAEQLGIERLGTSHQAGSDSLLSGMVFIRIKYLFFLFNLGDSRFVNHIFDIGPACLIYTDFNNHVNNLLKEGHFMTVT